MNILAVCFDNSNCESFCFYHNRYTMHPQGDSVYVGFYCENRAATIKYAFT